MNFSTQDIQGWASMYYGLTVSVKTLNGFDELNFQLTDAVNNKYILKVAHDAHGLPFLDAQVKIINHLAASSLADKFQHYLLNREGNELTTIVVQGKNYYVRILSFMEGTFWVDLKNKSKSLYADLGVFMGEMDKVLQLFSHPAMHRHYTWDIQTALDANANLTFIKNHERRRIAGYFLLQFEMEVLPVLSSLRHAYVHNDANDYNVLVKGDKVVGLIDFGDMVYTPLINNLAVACTYAMLNCEQPLQVAVDVVKGYHQVYPLTIQELDLLYYLIAGRLCISVTQSARNASTESDNVHHFITETPAWNLLYQLIRINPLLAQDSFRKAG
ncbi:MAG: phosphotransferase, partial [Chitinophagaceae bacterium]